MNIQVLGELNVEVNGQSAVPRALKPRQILGLLVLNANRVVHTSSLIEEVWDGDPPQTMMTTLQTYILHIRKPLAVALGEPTSYVARNILITKSSGYAFKVPPNNIDLHVYDQLAAAGSDELARGDVDQAVNSLRSALRVWSDSPLTDVRPGRVLGAHINRLTDSRLLTMEKLIEAEFTRGRYDMVLRELTELSAAYPLHEKFHAQFMIALHRSGRRSQAIEVYHRLRREMVESLGLEPSSHVQHALQAILA